MSYRTVYTPINYDSCISDIKIVPGSQSCDIIDNTFVEYADNSGSRALPKDAYSISIIRDGSFCSVGYRTIDEEFGALI